MSECGEVVNRILALVIRRVSNAVLPACASGIDTHVTKLLFFSISFFCFIFSLQGVSDIVIELRGNNCSKSFIVIAFCKIAGKCDTKLFIM